MAYATAEAPILPGFVAQPLALTRPEALVALLAPVEARDELPHASQRALEQIEQTIKGCGRTVFDLLNSQRCDSQALQHVLQLLHQAQAAARLALQLPHVARSFHVPGGPSETTG